MEKLEKIVWIVAGIVVVLVVAFIFVGPLKSEISKDAMDEAFRQVNEQHGGRGRPKVEAPGAVQPRNFGAAPAGASVARTPSRTVQKPQSPAAPEGGDPQQQPQPPQGDGQPPWQPPQGQDQSVASAGEAAPVYIPQVMADKYQHFEDLVELGQSAAGEDYITPQGEQAYILRGINEDSMLSTRLGFQPGDIIISVNGYAPSRANARQLWSTLRGSKDFQVVLERGGQRMTKPYHIR